MTFISSWTSNYEGRTKNDFHIIRRFEDFVAELIHNNYIVWPMAKFIDSIPEKIRKFPERGKKKGQSIRLDID